MLCAHVRCLACTDGSHRSDGSDAHSDVDAHGSGSDHDHDADDHSDDHDDKRSAKKAGGGRDRDGSPSGDAKRGGDYLKFPDKFKTLAKAVAAARVFVREALTFALPDWVEEAYRSGPGQDYYRCVCEYGAAG